MAADEVGRVADLRCAAGAAASRTRRTRRRPRRRSPRARRRRRRGSARRRLCFPVASSTTSTRDALGSDLARAACERASQQRDRVALGLDRAAVERAEPAVVARGPAVVRRRCSHPSARGTGGSRAVPPPGTVSVVRNMSAPGGIGYGTAAPRGERVAGVVAGHADDALRLGVERLHLRRSRPASRRRRRRRPDRAPTRSRKSTSR